MLYSLDKIFTCSSLVEAYYLEITTFTTNIVWDHLFILSIRVDLCFAVHKLAKFSSNPGKLYFEGLVHLLRYIRYNNNLVLNIMPVYSMHLYITS